MLEHFEVLELEKKWEEYDKKRRKFGFNTKFFTPSKLKFDKTVTLLLLFISVSLGGIAWLLFSDSKDIMLSEINQNINTKTTVSTPIDLIPDEEIDENLTKFADQGSQVSSRGALKINDIGVNTSVDAGGFVLNNTYSPQQSDSEILEKKPFSTVPKDEIIDFGNPPAPPRSLISSVTNKPSSITSSSKGRIVIKTSNLKESKSTLEEKFYSSNDIMYSLMLSENAYNKKNYDEAIKWALISNEIDKDNAKSWILFAKANYKKGNKDDALLALETFSNRLPNKEVDGVIKQIKDGGL